MLNPSVLCQTFTLLQEIPFDPENPFVDNPPFDPDDPFAEDPAELVPEGDRIQETVLTKVRLSESSGDRAVDARGDSTAHQAILFFVFGISRAGGSLEAPAIKEGDKLVEGIHEDITPYDVSTVVGDDSSLLADDEDSSAVYIPATGERVWTVKGVKTLKSRSRDHHMEVSLV